MTRWAKSSTFESADGFHGAVQTIGFAPDEATAKAAILAIGNRNLPDCYEQTLTATSNSTDPAASVPDGLTLTSLTMEPLDLTGLAEPDEAVWWTVTAELDHDGQLVMQFFDLVFMRVDRVLSQVELTGIDSEFPDDLDGPVVQRVLELMEGISEVAA